MAPTVFSQALRINPLLVIFALLLGGQLYGFIGAFIALPIAAIAARERRLLPPPLPLRPLGPAVGRRAAAGRAAATAARSAARRARSGRPSARPAAPSSAGRTPRPPPRRARPGSARRRDLEALRRARRAARRLVRGRRRRAGRGDRPQRRRQDDAAADPRRRAARRPRAPCRPSGSAGSRSSRRCTRSSRWPRTCGCSRGSRRSPTSSGPSTRMLEQTALADRAGDEVGKLSGGNRQRVNIAIGLLGEPAVLLLDEPSASLDPRQRERLWEFIGALGTTVVFSTHDVGEAERFADRVLVLADGELLFTGTPAELVGRRPRLRGGLRPLPPRARSLMRWLLLKDLQILRRSPLLVALLVIYPIVIAVLFGFALSGGPEKPRVAFANLVPPGESEFQRRRADARRRRLRRPAVRVDRPDRGRHARGGDREGPLRRGARRARAAGGRDRAAARRRSGSAAATRPPSRSTTTPRTR